MSPSETSLPGPAPLQTAVAALLAFVMIAPGINKFVGFASLPVLDTAGPRAVMTALEVSYLGWLVGVTEIAGGLLLLRSSTRFGGLVVLAPVAINIVALHAFALLVGNGLWIALAALYALAAWPYRERFAGLFRAGPAVRR